MFIVVMANGPIELLSVAGIVVVVIVVVDARKICTYECTGVAKRPRQMPVLVKLTCTQDLVN